MVTKIRDPEVTHVSDVSGECGLGLSGKYLIGFILTPTIMHKNASFKLYETYKGLYMRFGGEILSSN